MITPEQKAKELVSKYYDILPNWVNIDDAKQCALIAVEEIIKRTRSVDTMPHNYQKIDENTKEYWEQVKIEIQKL
jgi:hypothetical protein